MGGISLKEETVVEYEMNNKQLVIHPVKEWSFIIYNECEAVYFSIK
jgi:hypothetical protein